MSRVILEGVEGAEEQLGGLIEPYQDRTVQQYRVKQYEDEDARYEAVEDARDHERPAHVPAGGTHEIHHPYLVTGGVDGETDGVEHDEERADCKKDGLRDAVLFRGIDNFRQPVNGCFILIEIHFVYRRARARFRILLRLEILGDCFVLARLLRADFERGGEGILTELVERLERQLVILMARAEIGKRLLSADVRYGGHLGQRLERLLDLLYLVLRRVGAEIDGDVHFVGEVLERRGHCRIRYHDVDEHERHDGHHENGGERDEAVADEADETVPCYPFYGGPEWHRH